jgi:plastocyanin
MKRLALAAIVLASCDGADPDPPQPPPPAIDPATAGTIRGKVLFRGTPPPNPLLKMASECAVHYAAPPLDEQVLVKDGRLQNVFVHVKEGLGDRAFGWPTAPVTMANEKCVYVPRVLGVQVHQPVLFTNEDATDHNIHGFTARGQFNFALRGKGTSAVHKLRQAEVGILVKCDIHPWMIGYIAAVPHPFFRVTGPDGTFQLPPLPPGEYVIEAWHEKYKAQTKRAKLGPGESLELDFEVAPR